MFKYYHNEYSLIFVQEDSYAKGSHTTTIEAIPSESSCFWASALKKVMGKNWDRSPVQPDIPKTDLAQPKQKNNISFKKNHTPFATQVGAG